MKTFRLIWTVLYAALLCFAMVSCSKDDDSEGDGEDGAIETPDGESEKKNRTFNVKDVEFKMVYVEGGTFMMGCDDVEARGDERTVHKVTLSDYYIGQTEVTQALWKAVMRGNPSFYIDANRPVLNVSWDDCQRFIKRLNEITGENFCLPTEAEWEFAARGGIHSKGYKYSGSNNVDVVAWYEGNSDLACHVGKKQPNELYIYDMSGNVAEWCSDWYDYYSYVDVTDPTGPSSGSFRILRGGCYGSQAAGCRSTFRGHNTPTYSYYTVGLRLALK